MKYIILLTALLTNCGHSGDTRITTNCKEIASTCGNGKQDVSEGLRKPLAFVEYKLGIEVKYDVVFADIDEDGVAGQCVTDRKGTPLTILIDRLSWAESDKEGKRHLLYHEVGHCSYGLDHSSVIGTVMYYSFSTTGLKGRYEQAHKEFVELYNTYGR